MKYLTYLLIILCTFGLSTAFLPKILPYNLVIDIGLVLCISISTLTKGYTGVWFAGCFGLLIDVLIGPAVGLYALFYMTIAYLIIKFWYKLPADNLIALCMVVFLTYIVKDIYLCLYSLLIGNVAPLNTMFIGFTLLSAILTTVCCIPVHLFDVKIHECSYMRPKQRVVYTFTQPANKQLTLMEKIVEKFKR